MQQVLSPNCWTTRFGAVPRWIICHGTAGFETAQEVAAFFGSTVSGVSAHYVVGGDGTVIQCVPEASAAWANGFITGPAGVGGDGIHHDAWWDDVAQWNNLPNPNLATISIEHVKPSQDNSDQLTPAQQAASFALIRDICARNSIPARLADANGGVTGHFSMDPVNRSRCPGPYPWSALQAYLQQQGDTPMQITDPFASLHFTQLSPTTWRCKDNNIDVHDGILAYWRAAQGAFRLPRTAELYSLIPGCVVQVFEGGALCYDPSGKYDKPGLGPVYALHLDKDTPGLRQLIGLAGLKVA